MPFSYTFCDCTISVTSEQTSNEHITDTTRPPSKYGWKALQQKLTNGHYRRSGVFIVNFEHISHFALLFLLLTLSRSLGKDLSVKAHSKITQRETFEH